MSKETLYYERPLSWGQNLKNGPLMTDLGTATRIEVPSCFFQADDSQGVVQSCECHTSTSQTGSGTYKQNSARGSITVRTNVEPLQYPGGYQPQMPQDTETGSKQIKLLRGLVGRRNNDENVLV